MNQHYQISASLSSTKRTFLNSLQNVICFHHDTCIAEKLLTWSSTKIKWPCKTKQYVILWNHHHIFLKTWYCAHTYRTAQSIPEWHLGEALFMECGLLSDYNTERWTIGGNMFGDCHVPCTLKPFFVDFGKEYAHCSHHFIHFCSFIYILLNLFSFWI